MFPLAGAGELIEDEAGRAGAEHGPTVGALVVLVAVGGVLVLEVSVLARALDAGGLGDFWGRLRVRHGGGEGRGIANVSLGGVLRPRVFIPGNVQMYKGKAKNYSETRIKVRDLRSELPSGHSTRKG